jgi:hypothetical protein
VLWIEFGAWGVHGRASSGGAGAGWFATIVYSVKTLLFWRWFVAGTTLAWNCLESRNSPVARPLHSSSSCLIDSSWVFLDVRFLARSWVEFCCGC